MSSIVQLHGRAFGRIENGIDSVPLVDDALVQPGLRLLPIVAASLSAAVPMKLALSRSARFWSSASAMVCQAAA